MTRFERWLEWLMNEWGFWATKFMWSERLLLRALGMVMSILGILIVGMFVGVFVVVNLVKQRLGVQTAKR